MKKTEVQNDLVSFIFGIISIVFAFFSPAPGVVFGIVGIVQSKKQKTPLAKKGKKLSMIGLILSIVMLIFSLALILYSIKTGNFQTGAFPY